MAPGAPSTGASCPPGSAALIVEFGGEDAQQLDLHERRALDLLDGADLLHPIDFTRDEDAINHTWEVREGLFGLVGRLRPLGTALIIEDVCVRPERIAECAARSAGAAGQA